MFGLINDKIRNISPDEINNINESRNCLSQDSMPIAESARTWNSWNYFTLWLGMMISIPVYMLASGLISKGMNWWQAVLVIVLGHTLVMVPAVALGHFGTKYGASFAMLSKMIFGPVGNYLPTLIRALLGCFWFGVQCWIGGQAVDAVLTGIFTELWSNVDMHLWLSFGLFFILNIYIAYHGAEGIKFLQNLAAPILVFLGVAVVYWAYQAANGDWNQLLTTTAAEQAQISFWILFFPALSAMIAFDGTLALNTSDFTRNAVSQKAQVVGQLIGAPIMTLFICLVGVIGTNGSLIVYGEAIWNPAELVARFDNPFVVIIFSMFIILATITTNIAGNLVPPGMVFSSLFAKQLSYKKAIILASFLALLGQPWSVLADPDNYIFVVLGNLAAFLGPMAGIYMASYWFEHKTEVNFVDLYKVSEGRYYYSKGINITAILCLFSITFICLISQFFSVSRFIFDNSYVIGAFAAFFSYIFMIKYYDKHRNFRNTIGVHKIS